jgi:hypothetical protein
MIFFLVAVGSLTDFALQGFFGSSPSSTAEPRMLERMSKMPSIVDTSRPASWRVRIQPWMTEGWLRDRSSRRPRCSTMWLRTVAS